MKRVSGEESDLYSMNRCMIYVFHGSLYDICRKLDL